MAKMASERNGAPVTMHEVLKRMAGDETDEIRRIGKQLGFEDEAAWWIQQSMGSASEFRDALIAMLKAGKIKS
jgi:hypothetical protein